MSDILPPCDHDDCPKAGPCGVMTHEEFEAECRDKIMGDIWDGTFSEDYCEGITLSIQEMRQIANLFRNADGAEPGKVFEIDTGEEKEAK